MTYGALVLLEGDNSMGSSKPDSYDLNFIKSKVSQNEMLYTFSQVLVLNKQGHSIQANFSEQINFMLDRNVPAELLFSFLTL